MRTEDDLTIRIIDLDDDEEARRLEAGLLEESDKSLSPEDPEVQEPDDDSAGVDAEVDLTTGERRLGPVTAERILARARSQLGYREGSKNDTKFGSWYKMNRQPWCAMFVSWVFHQEGLPLPASTSKGFAYCPSGAAWFKRHNRWTTKPAPGHVVFYNLPNKLDRIDHVGIVERVNPDGTIRAIEGNTTRGGSREGDGVYRKTRRVGVAGYGIPDYGAATKVPARPGRYLKHPPGTSGDDVRMWQQQMRNRGWRRMVVDGAFRQLDHDLCRLFQQEKGLEVDGVVGPDTWAATWTAPVT